MQTFLRFAIVFIISIYSCTNNNQVHSQKTANKLINETSPYLLQHAYNPVDWHPWNEESLQKAKDENKLLIVSIGYAACHWCHVMEHESFEDSTVAAMMNEHFLPIKVDREERPDVDQIYMAAAQLVSGNGGWPLNAFALPDGRPIWAGTYFPKERWMGILEQFAELKDKNYERLENSANQLVSGIKSLDMIEISEPQEYTSSDINQIAQDFLQQLDLEKGGRKGAPKFPMPRGYSYLLRYGTMFNDKTVLQAVETTLMKMAQGGIYDQVGGGFARYSVDDRWFAPHFEKMLYDNAQLISLYSDAYRINKNPTYRKIIEQSIKFVEREMMNSEGGFYSSLDADSEGEEGKFYVWTNEEINRLITDPQSNQIIKSYYNIKEEGNWEHQNNILHITQDKTSFVNKHNLSIEELDVIISTSNATLLAERDKRIRPGLDDKVLTSWNALMIKGYIDAYKALGKEDYLRQAIESTRQLIKSQMHNDYRLERNYKDGKASINAFLDDYALLIQTLLAIYEVTFDEEWLEVSKNLTDYAIQHFYNPESKLFYYTSDLDPPLVTRKTDLADDVIPGSNSTMANVLYRLGELYYEQEYIDMSKQMLSNLWPNITQSRQPSFYSNWLNLQLDIFSPPYEVAIMGKDALTTTHQMMQTYHPNVVYIGSEEDSELPLLLYKYREDQTMIYVCKNKTCKLPVSDISKALKLIE